MLAKVITTKILLAIFVIVTAMTLIAVGSIAFAASALPVKKRSIGGSGSGSTTTTTALSQSSVGGSSSHFNKFVSCMMLFSGPVFSKSPLTRAVVDQCFNIVYGNSSNGVAAVSNSTTSRTSSVTPKVPSATSASTTSKLSTSAP